MNFELEELLGLNKPNRRVRLPKVELRARLTRTRGRLHLLRRRVRKPSAAFVEDASLLAGLAAIAAGCGWIFPPTAPIVGGLFLVVLSLRAASAAAHTDAAEPQLRDEPLVRTVYGPDDEDED